MTLQEYSNLGVSELKRRAEMYEELVECLKLAVGQIPEDGDFYQRSMLRKARAVIAKCEKG